MLTKCKSTDNYSDRQNVHSNAFIASNAHALFGSIMVYITTRANYESPERTLFNRSLNLMYWKVQDTHQMCSTVQIHQTLPVRVKMQGDKNKAEKRNGFGYGDENGA